MSAVSVEAPTETATDARIDAIINHTPTLKMVGNGTIADILAAAEALGLIPEQTVSTHFGLDYRSKGGGVFEMNSQKSCEDLNAAASGGQGGVTGPVVSRTVTTYKARYSEWLPVAEPAGAEQPNG
jgi:hypothetical protein